MIKSLQLFLMIFVIFLFSACAKAPEKTGIEELVGELKTENCGNGEIDLGEECDFEGLKSCSEYRPDYVGAAFCKGCEIYYLNCTKKDICSEKKCKGKGECKDSEVNGHKIYCECYDNRAGLTCEEGCKEGFHFDFDGSCIADNLCTQVGCENENKECIEDNGQAKCQCIFPWTGENCDKCDNQYFLEDGMCKGKYCYVVNFKCGHYEHCVDTSGKPECVCKTEKQIPDNCSRCQPEYTWDEDEEFCINFKRVECVHNPEAPVNSKDKAVLSVIYYTNENGWTDPAYCDFECISGGNSCVPPVIKKYEVDFLNYPRFLGHYNNWILVQSHNKIFSFSKEIMTVSAEIPELGKTFSNASTSGAIVGNDGNNYFTDGSLGIGIYFREKSSFISLKFTRIINNNLSLIPSGVSFGNSYLDFPEIIDIGASDSEINITDENGNILSIFDREFVQYNDKNWNLLWKKEYDDLIFSMYPVIDKQGNAYLPFHNNITGEIGILIIDTADGNIINKIEAVDEYSTPPKISIGINGKKYMIHKGVLTVLDKNYNIITESSDESQYSNGNTYQPVITDSGLIYFNRADSIVCVNENGELVWTQKIESSIRGIIHYDHALYVLHDSGLVVYDAPGNLSGDWPQMKHDSRLSNSLMQNEFVDPPLAPVSQLPENGDILNTNSVTFSWQTDSGDPEIKYTLLLRDPTGYDKVYAGPETGFSTVTVNNLAKGAYEWRVVSQDSNGSLNVSDARTFTIN